MELLERLGAECLHGPVIHTQRHGRHDELEELTRDLIEQPPDAVVVMTGIGVRSWFEAADSVHLGEQLRAALREAQVLTRGSKAAGAAVAAGLDVTWNAPTAQSSDVVAELRRRCPGRRVAVQLDGGQGDALSDALTSGGFDVVAVPVYRWTLPDDVTAAERLVRAVAEVRVDAVSFTARPAVANFMAIAEGLGLGDDVRNAFARDVLAACVGPVCAAGARDVGIERVVQPDRPRLGPMVQVLASHLVARVTTLRLAGDRAVVQGRMVFVGDDQRFLLSHRERDLLLALAERPGAVLSKRELLSRVWHDRERDTHAVEVAVGRLRQRLGPAGCGVETVLRRGYRLTPE